MGQTYPELYGSPEGVFGEYQNQLGLPPGLISLLNCSFGL
jgi:hypothetical protein